MTLSSDMPMLDCGSSGDKSVTWSDSVISVDNDGIIEYQAMSLEGGTGEGSVGVSESKIRVQFENRKTWQHSSQP